MPLPLDIFLRFLAPMLTILSVSLAYYSFRRGNRRERFKKMLDSLKANPHSLRKRIIENKRDCNKADVGCGCIEPVPHLLRHKEWFYHRDGSLRLLKDVVELKAGHAFPSRRYSGGILFPEMHKAVKKLVPLPAKHLPISENLLDYTGANLFNDQVYGVGGIEISDNKLRLTVNRAGFFDYIDSCYGYQYDAAYQRMRGRTRLRLKRKFPVTDFTNRHAAIGVCTFTILKDVIGDDGEKQNHILILRRGDRVSDGKGLFCNVPAGFYQPSYSLAQAVNEGAPREEGEKTLQEAIDEEWFLHNVVREFNEEIMDVEECSEQAEKSEVEKCKVWKMLEKNVYFLGFGLNPLTTHFEMLTVAIIDVQSKEAKAAVDFTTKKKVEDFLDKHNKGRHEGEIELKPFTKAQLTFYERSRKATPALAQSCCIIKRDFETFSG